MISFFTVPKPCVGDVARIQRTAIGSWRRLHPDCELFLCGGDAGIKELADETRGVVVRDIDCNEYGTPLLDSVFACIGAQATHRYLAYLNADVMLVDDLRPLARQIRWRRFLLVSRRYNLPAAENVSLDGDDWRERSKRTAMEKGELGPASQCDLFIFPNDPVFTEIPAFAVGRPGWDNWYIFNAYRRRIRIVDASRELTLIHQHHGYTHVPESSDGAWNGTEGDRNRQLAGGWHNLFTLDDATCAASRGGIRVLRDATHVQRRVERMRLLRPRLFQRLRSWRLRTLLCRMYSRL